MRFTRHTDKWWTEPTLAPVRYKVPARYRHLDPMSPDAELKVIRPSRIGGFAPSRKWVRYNRLQAFDAGYITPLYSLRAITTRYGLSQLGTRYFRNNILPEPYDIVRIKSVSAHHWSLFTLMVLDVVMKDLEKRGRLQFLSSFGEHIALVDKGVAFLEDYYAEKSQEEHYNKNDKFGVQWFD
jgi:hypothetical protein